MNCRFCGHPLTHVFIDLGSAPPSNSFLDEKALHLPEKKYPLKLFVCDNCFLVQLDEFKKAAEIFSDHYVYYSSYSTSWLAHAKRYAELITQRLQLDGSSLVIEIASNDGYLLQYFKEKNIPVLGIEPATGTAEIARKKNIETITDFFDTRLADRLTDERRQADLLVGNNVLAHVPDINNFVSGLKKALKPRGVITMEFPHLLRLVNENQFDTIYHEHFSYLSFTTVNRIFSAHGLWLFDVEELPTHGGSLRIFAAHLEDNTKIKADRVEKLLDQEREAGITNPAFYNGFSGRVDRIRECFLDFLSTARKENKKVAGYGAAAKGNTLLNYCGVTGEQILCVADASPFKQEKFLPGSHIPVVSEERLKKIQPDFIIIFPWNIQHEIMDQLSYSRSWGSRFVTCIPNLHIQ